MRYIFVSDIHGEYDKLIEELTYKHVQIKRDTIVFLGDCFDRGVQNQKLLDFIDSLPNKIIVLGNHDLVLYTMLEQASRGEEVYHTTNDIHNGTIQTLFNLAGYEGMCPYDVSMFNFGTRDEHLAEFFPTPLARKVLTRNGDKLRRYFDNAVYAVSFGDEIFAAHGWFPPRLETTSREWWLATWCDTPAKYNKLKSGGAAPASKLLVGHWHACDMRRRETQEGKLQAYFNNTRFISHYKNNVMRGQVIFLDGCTNITAGRVNAYSYYSETPPQLYNAMDGNFTFAKALSHATDDASYFQIYHSAK